MKLSRFEIEGLFGRYNYYFQLDSESNYLILTGPNGYGKTTILTIINALAKSDLFYFYSLPFLSVKLLLADGCCLFVTAKTILDESDAQDTPNEGNKEIEFKWINVDQSESKFVINGKIVRKAMRSIGYYEGRRLRSDVVSSKDFHDFARRNPRMLQIIAQEQNSGNAFLLQIKSLATVFIEAQRILKPKVSKQIDLDETEYLTSMVDYTIDDVAKRIKQRIRRAKYDFLSFSQEKDNQFINKLINDTFSRLTQQEYEEKRKKLIEQTRELYSYDLIDNVIIPEYSESHGNELSAYIQDISEKFEKLDDICGKLKLFTDIIERKGFTAKKVSFSVEKGIRVQTDDFKWISLSDLSSGEQNIIIMLYYLVFEFGKNKLLLIDEPEISLHIAWQFQYIDDLERILKLTEGQAIIATHSPQIIGERWEKCFDLTSQCK